MKACNLHVPVLCSCIQCRLLMKLSYLACKFKLICCKSKIIAANSTSRGQLQLAFTYFFASWEFCHLLINFANSLDPDRDRLNVILISIKTIGHSESVPKRILKRVILKKKNPSSDDNKNQHAKLSTVI